MTRIVFVNRFYRPDHSATAQMLTDLAQTLAKVGDDLRIEIVTSRLNYSTGKRSYCKKDEIDGVIVNRVWTTSFGRGSKLGRGLDYLSFYMMCSLWLSLDIKRNDLVVAKTDPPLISVLAAIVCRLKRARLVNWVQDLFPEVAVVSGVPLLRGRLGRLLKGVRNWSLKCASVNVAIGERMRERLVSEGVPPETMCVIQNWVIDPKIRPIAPKNNTLKREWDLPVRYLIGYSGNLGEAHDYILIRNTLLDLKDNPDLGFLFIGGGRGMERLKDDARLHGLSNVVFKPYQDIDRLAESLSMADVHIVSLKPEMEGLVVPSKFYGVLAVGRPVFNLGEPNGEISRLVNRFDLGCSVDPRNIDNFSVALLAMVEELMERPSWGSQIAQTFEEFFAHGRSIDLWRDTLVEVDRG